MQNLSQDDKQKIYAVYKAIFALDDIRRKKRMLTELMGGFEWSWRVVGITPRALELFAQNDYKRGKSKEDKTTRAHRVARVDTAKMLFEIPEPLPLDQFFEKFWRNDETVICVKGENRKIVPEFIEFNFFELGLFLCNPAVNCRHKNEEAECLRKLHTEIKARRQS